MGPGLPPAQKSAAEGQRDLAIAWMNRGHALMRAGDPDSLGAALVAYGEAIAHLQPLVHPGVTPLSWTNSLGAALMNRGQLLHRLHGLGEAPAALACFTEAATLLRSIPGGSEAWPRRNLAGTLLNQANLQLDLTHFDAAIGSAREALALTSPRERRDPVEAELSLKARRVLCDALGRIIIATGADQAALAAEASDLVDDALTMARHWIARGATEFQELAQRFFRYGTQLYRLHQPHFLAEFIREHLPSSPDPTLHGIAREAVIAALADRPHDRPYLILGDPASERHVHTARELEKLRLILSA